MSTKRQFSFGAVAITLAVLITTVFGFMAWRLYSLYSKPTSTVSIGQSNSQTPTQQQADPNEGYVVIKEWGVRFKPMEGLDGLEYVLKAKISRADFTTQQLAQASSNCNASEASGFSGLGGLGRYATNAEQPTTGTTFLVTMNGYSYYYGGGGAPCADSTTNATAANLLGIEKPELVESLKSLEAAK